MGTFGCTSPTCMHSPRCRGGSDVEILSCDCNVASLVVELDLP
jgi:hypothetical protein